MKENLRRLEIRGPEEPLGNISSLLMTTLSAMRDGSNPFLRALGKELPWLEYLAQQSSQSVIDVTGTSSVIVDSNFYTIYFYVKENNICLAILQNQGHGLREPLWKNVIMKVKFISLKLVIWLTVLTFLTNLAVSILLTRV